MFLVDNFDIPKGTYSSRPFLVSPIWHYIWR